MEKDLVIREEFDHLIAEFEAFKDNYFDEITKLTQQMEMLGDLISEVKQLLKESGAVSQNQKKLL